MARLSKKELRYQRAVARVVANPERRAAVAAKVMEEMKITSLRAGDQAQLYAFNKRVNHKLGIRMEKTNDLS